MVRTPTTPEPLVTVLVPTFNRRRYLPAAVGSVVEQTYRNLQIIVINDGGTPVRDIVKSFNDPRILLLERKQNRGKACSLNQALGYAEGKYIAYLDDDDIYYPHHVETLVGLLEGPGDCGAAYSDLYKTHCRIRPDGGRTVLGKVVTISRDFDRWFLLHFNHVLHISLMHRRDLLDKTGPYNESVSVLIDWDMTRRLAFFTDFAHSNEITGEFFGPVGRSDRISYRMRQDRAEYLRNVLTIRTTRPAKPWPKVKDLSIIFLPASMDQQAGARLRQIWASTCVPYKLYLPLPGDQLARLDTQMPNIVTVATDGGASLAERIDAALARCQGEYVALLGDHAEISPGWLLAGMYTITGSDRPRQAIRLPGITAGPAAIYRTSELLAARAGQPGATIERSLLQAGITPHDPPAGQYPYLFDDLLKLAKPMEADGQWLKAAKLYLDIEDKCGNSLWMRFLAAGAYYMDQEHHADAMELSRDLNRRRPTVDSLLLEAKLSRRADRMDQALALLRKARGLLREKG